MCPPASYQLYTPEQRQTQLVTCQSELVTFKHCSWCGRLPWEELGGLHKIQKTESLAWGHYGSLYPKWMLSLEEQLAEGRAAS